MEKTKSLRLLLWLIPALVVLAMLAGGMLLYHTYTLVDGELFRLDATELDWRDEGRSSFLGLQRLKNLRNIDLRGNSVSVQDYRTLQAALPDCRIRWDVPVDGQTYDSASAALSFADVPDDWENLTLFPDLRTVTFTNCTRYELAQQVRAALPACAVSWSVDVGAQWSDAGTAVLRLDGSETDYAELVRQLAQFPALRTLQLANCALSTEEQLSLAEQFPAVSFLWPVTVCGKTWSSMETALSYGPADALPDLTELGAALPLFPALTQIDLTGSPLTAEAVAAFRAAHPGLTVLWEVTIHGTAYPCDVTELDFSGVQLGSTAELEAAIPNLPRLEKVILCDCGFSDGEMAALSARYGAVRFVWRVYFGNYSLRTDATFFIASAWENGTDLYDWDITPLQYCVDLRGLDCGHMYFSDISFLYSMPHMQYLILAECPITDMTPIASCKELKYLEIFHTYVYDLSPLLECTALEDLNLSYIAANRNTAWDVLSQMTWLDRLWYCGTPLTRTQQTQLQELLPDCQMFMLAGGEPSGGSWRYSEHYYAMRDLFGMYYMPGGTNGVDDNGDQIIVDDNGREYHLVGWDGNPRWWEEEQYSDYHPYIIGVTD